MYRNNKNISIKGNWGIGNFLGLFLGIVLCVFFAACDDPEKERDPMPGFGSETIADKNYIQNSAIAAETLPEATGGDMPLSYSLAPLPDGLTFDSGTRVLSGTPTSAASTTVTYTATDADGDEATLSFSIVVTDPMPSLGSETIADKNYIQNSAIAAETLPEATGGNLPLSYAADPLPDGLMFDNGTRVLSGTPTSSGTTMVTYTATDADGDEATLGFSIMVAADTQPSFGATVPDQSYTQGRTIEPLQLPQAGDGNAPLTYSLSPVPAGLTFDSGTQMLTGTPSAALSSTDLTYTVQDADGDTATLMFSIVVAANLVPSFGSRTIDDQVYFQGIGRSSLILPAAMGGDLPLTYRLAPLPDGMMFDSVTRELSGSPTATGSTPMTYTAGDTNGDEITLTFNIVVRMPVSSGICDRTQQVQDGIIAAISSTPACDAVTVRQLGRINRLTITNQNIGSLQTNDFDGLSNLRVLTLWGNSLTTLPEDVFDGLTNLMDLNLNDNDLTTLPEDVFEELTSLTILNLSENDLTSLPSDVFDGLSSLDNLVLSGNDLTSLPSDVFEGLTSLTRLDLRDNNGLTAPHEDLFDGLTSLTRLDLGNNNMANPHEDLFDGLTSLTRLILSGNNMANPHEDLFDGLTSLQTLDLRNNIITTLHADLFDGLTSLMYLDLRGNASLVPPAICSTAVDCTLP